MNTTALKCCSRLFRNLLFITLFSLAWGVVIYGVNSFSKKLEFPECKHEVTFDFYKVITTEHPEETNPVFKKTYKTEVWEKCDKCSKLLTLKEEM